MSHLLETGERQKKKRLLLFLIIIFVLGIGYFEVRKYILIKPAVSQKVLSSITVKSTPASTPTIPLSPTIYERKTSLSDAINTALLGTQGTYGVAVENLKTGESYFLNEHRTFEAGSLYKLWVMATVYSQIKDGVLSEDNILSEDVPVLNEKFYITPEDAEQTEGKITLSVSDALNQMITVSDNYSALLLTEKIRLSRIASFLKDNELIESTVGTTGDDPTTTAYDVALFFKKLYKGELNEPQYSEKMLNLLKAQKLNNKIPKYLPNGIVIAHKTGEIYGFSHDTGIVYTPNGDYIIALFSESNDPSQAEERLASLSKAVYSYLAD